MPDNFNELTASETERLSILAEELGEAVQAVGKILRHGYKSKSPFELFNNRQNLEKELSHVIFAMEMLNKSGDINEKHVEEHLNKKAESAKRWLHHQPLDDADVSDPV